MMSEDCSVQNTPGPCCRDRSCANAARHLRGPFTLPAHHLQQLPWFLRPFGAVLIRRRLEGDGAAAPGVSLVPSVLFAEDAAQQRPGG